MKNKICFLVLMVPLHNIHNDIIKCVCVRSPSGVVSMHLLLVCDVAGLILSLQTSCHDLFTDHPVVSCYTYSELLAELSNK